MKLKSKILAGGTVLAIFACTTFAQETRQIKVIEDRDQTFMTTKVYELKNARAADMTPFVLGAVQRYYKYSSVERLNDKANKRQILTVNMPVSLVPYIDDMVAKLDRPGVTDSQNSVIMSTGIAKLVYYPEHRASADMLPLGPTVGSSNGAYYFDSENNMFFWKDVRDKAESALKWYQAFDMPVPQVELNLNVYEINEGDLKELGVDYVNWKNGPGANIFNAGLDIFNMKHFTSVSNPANITNIVGNASHMWAGWMVAPQFDATFIKLLAQKGKAKISTSGALTVANDFLNNPGDNNFSHAKYKIKFTPNYQTLQKDKDQNTGIYQTPDEFYFYLKKPTVNFDGDKAEKAVNLEFGWELSIMETVEQTSKGTPVQNVNFMRSWLTLQCGTEKLLAEYTKESDVEQYNGIPFLGDIPVLKYLFGSVEHNKPKTRIFVTVVAKSITPTENMSEWSGKAVTVKEMLAAKEEKKEVK